MKVSITLLYFIFSIYNLMAQSVPHYTAIKSYAMPNSCGITVNAGPDITICAGEGKMLNGTVTNSTDYMWEPPDGLSNPTILRPTANPSMTTTYTLTAKGISGNIITNGSFETGSINPSTSQYTQYTDLNAFVMSTGGYMVMSVPQIAMAFGCNPNIGAFTMAITPTNSSSDIWCQTKTVTPNTEYKIDFTLIGIPYIFGAPPVIGLKINGVLIGSMEPTSGFCTETDVSFTWNSGSATSANFCFANYGGTGNLSMCAIDDISVKECCVEKDEVTVTVYELNAEVAPPDEINCLNRPLTLDGSASSQGPGITYNWSTRNGRIISGGNTLRPQVDTPGTYTLKITGLHGCEKEIMVVVTGSVTKPDVKIVSKDIDCKNPLGSIEASSKSSSPQYEWNGPNGYFSTRANNYNLSEAGEYIVKVTDSYGCESTAKVEIKDNRTEILADILGDTISCSKDSALLKANSAAYKPVYNWLGPNGYKKDSSSSAGVRDTGWYYLITTDSAGCNEMDSFYVLDFKNAIPVSIQNPDTLNCTRDSIQLTLNTDTTASILWNGPGGFVSNQRTPIVADTGWYFVRVLTSSGCLGFDSILVQGNYVLPILNSPLNDTLTCDEKSLVVKSGNLNLSNTVEWILPSGNRIQNLDSLSITEAGVYKLKLTAPNGCADSASFIILTDTVVFTPAEIIHMDSILTCKNDSLILNSNSVNARQTWWTGPNNYIDTLASIKIFEKGSYILHVISTDNGCSSTDTIIISEDKVFPSLSIRADTINCSRVSIIPDVVTDTTVSKFSWLGPNGFTSSSRLPVLSMGGNYTLTVKGSNGCETMQSISVVEDLLKPFANLSADTIQCKTTAFITANNISSGAKLEWTGPNAFQSNLAVTPIATGGWYKLRLTATNGCIFEDSVFVIQKDVLPDIFAFDDTLDCNRPKLFLNGGSGTPGASFEWTGPNGFTSNLPRPEIQDSGIYTLKVTDANGCEAIRQLRIVKNAEAAILTIQKSNDEFSCKDSIIQIQLSFNQNPNLILWTGPGGFQSNQTNLVLRDPGIYRIIFTNDAGCITRDSFTITDLRIFPDFTTTNDSMNCLRTQISLNLVSSNPSYVYSWTGPNNFNSTQKNPLITFGGQFTVLVTDTTNACSAIQVVDIKSDTVKPDLSLSADTITCLRPSAPVKAGSSLQGFTMRWTGPNNFMYTLPQFATKDPGRYTCTITNPRSGCSTTAFIDVLEDTARIRNVSANGQNASCNKDNGKIQILQISGGKPPYRFSIDNGNTFIADLSTLNLAPGNYTLLTEDGNGCQFTNTVAINRDPSVDINLPLILQLKPGEQRQLFLNILTDTAFVADISWFPSDQLSCQDCPNPIVTANHDDLITVRVTDINGCFDTASIRLQLLKESEIYFPNSFTPNGDNINDFFYPHSQSPDAIVNTLMIFDRWGNLIFQKQGFPVGSEAEGWNGLSQDQNPMNPGVYIYFAEISETGKITTYSGDLTLIR